MCWLFGKKKVNKEETFEASPIEDLITAYNEMYHN